jgi:hypothetical protein
MPRCCRCASGPRGAEHLETLATRDALASWTRAGGPAKARDQYAVLLSVYQRVLGPDHPKTLTTWAYHAYRTGKRIGAPVPA